MSEKEFYLAADMFLSNLFRTLKTNNIELQGHWDIDHLCYRTNNSESYLRLKAEFKSYGTLLIASEVNGREISTYELFKPIAFQGWKIHLIELPAPKFGKLTTEGFEHAEVVCDIPFEELIRKYEHLALDRQGLKKTFNQELEILLGPNNLKFHHLSLLSVINIEKNKKVWTAIENSKVLENFSQNAPLIVGDFPLNIEVENSDVDILLKFDNVEEFKNKLSQCFGSINNFSLSCTKINGIDSVICIFNFNEVAFKIFAQDREPIRQAAYLHFLIEERLLKFGGSAFKDKVLKERMDGNKIEPAIAAILGITGDPYLTLLELQKSTSEYLIKLLSTII